EIGSHIAPSRAQILQKAAKDFNENGDAEAFLAKTEEIAQAEDALGSDVGRNVAAFIREQGAMKVEYKRLEKQKKELDKVKKQWAENADAWADQFKVFWLSQKRVEAPTAANWK